MLIGQQTLYYIILSSAQVLSFTGSVECGRGFMNIVLVYFPPRCMVSADYHTNVTLCKNMFLFNAGGSNRRGLQNTAEVIISHNKNKAEVKGSNQFKLIETVFPQQSLQIRMSEAASLIC